MGISEKKMQIVLNNYFEQECDVNTSIREAFEKGFKIGVKKGISAQPEWNNHTVACLLAEMFGEDCACNLNGIDEWLPEKCELLDSCPNPGGVACWEQFLKYKAERRTDG